jgi:hypothetical protein
MSICKPPRWSRAKEAEHRDYLLRMPEGVDVEIPEEWQEHSRALDIVVGGPIENMVFESATGGIVHPGVEQIVQLRRPGSFFEGHR